jgi:Ca2+-binding RTX toxin-like protein
VIDQNGGTENYQIGKLDLSVQQFETFAQTNDLSGFENAVFGGHDVFKIGDFQSGALNYLEGFDGNDTFVYDGTDTIDGGGGYNTVKYFSDGLILPGTFENIQKIIAEPGIHEIDLQNYYNQNPDMSGGQPLTIDGHLASSPTSSFPFMINASDQSVPVTIIGGAGNDELIGGTGPDYLIGGMGQDVLSGGSPAGTTFIYHSAAESTSTTCDAIEDFDADFDRFQVPHAVTGMDPALSTGTFNYANFDTDLKAALHGHLDPYHAVLFTADIGDLAGEPFLIIDQNGVAGYQPGHDIVIAIDPNPHFSLHLSDLSIANFITPA